MSSKAAGWKRDNLRIRFPSARSIEETGLDSSRLPSEEFSPHFSQARHGLAGRRMFSNGRADGQSGQSDNRKKKLASNRSFRSRFPHGQQQQDGRNEEQEHHAKSRHDRRKPSRKGQHKLDLSRGLEPDAEANDNLAPEPENGGDTSDGQGHALRVFLNSSSRAEAQVYGDDALSSLPNVVLTPRKSGVRSFGLDAPQADDFSVFNSVTTPASSEPLTSSVTFEEEHASPASVSFIPAMQQASEAPPHEPQPASQILEARSRWRRLRHTVVFANHLANSRTAPADLLEEKRVEELNEGAGGVGAAAFEGSKTGSQPRLKGRKGMEGLIVRQDKSLISFIQDFYVACLKMPIGYFLVGVFLSPVALGLLFTPFYLINVEGLTFDESMGDQGFIGSLGSVKEKCFALLSVFLYSLSLSTTFGGSPVNAVSPYCLLLANVNTLMAQFLFVFLSGAVFARMSQPSHPIRCSKKAIVRKDDYIPALVDGEKLRVLGIRLVLTGPPPCELVDAKICLTFRIFVTLPSGSMFCSTQDLELVRPEVSYLRYGLMVRHIIDKKSPVYGHTLESLTEGDASFSLTVMGLERASMQPIFHLEDYFVYDGDIVWDGDYMDFIHINDSGQRVLDHSKIDLLRNFKVAGHVSKAVCRMKKDAEDKRAAEAAQASTTSPLKRWVTSGLRNRKLMSASFTRACDSG